MRRVLQRPRPYPKWTAAIEMFLERPNKPQVFCVSATHGVWSSAMCAKAAKNTMWDQSDCKQAKQSLPGQPQLAILCRQVYLLIETHFCTLLALLRTLWVRHTVSSCVRLVVAVPAESIKDQRARSYHLIVEGCWHLLSPATHHPHVRCTGAVYLLPSKWRCQLGWLVRP